MNAVTTGTDGESLLDNIRASPKELTIRAAFMDWAGENAETVRGWALSAMAKEPTLGSHGMGVTLAFLRGVPAGRRGPVGMMAEEFERSRDELPGETTAFAACLAWLATCRTRRTVNPGETSYGYKHRVERAFDNKVYVANGVFIAAAIWAGVPYYATGLSINTLHGISKRSLPGCY